MGSMKMPEGCTYDVMCAMYDIVNRIEDREYAAEQIKWYESLWRRYLPKYNEDEEGYGKIMKLIKQGIVFWREELSE